MVHLHPQSSITLPCVSWGLSGNLCHVKTYILRSLISYIKDRSVYFQSPIALLILHVMFSCFLMEKDCTYSIETMQQLPSFYTKCLECKGTQICAIFFLFR